MSAPQTAADLVPSPPPSQGRRWLAYGLVLAAAAAGAWFGFGRRLWSEYQKLQGEVRASEDNAPVGYVGLNYRRTYNDRPLVFHGVKDGRKTLFAAKGEGAVPEVYDVTEADFDPQCLAGGFGRDSIPGVDYPVLDGPGANKGRNLRDRQDVFGSALKSGPRAYPKDLLEKIEVVNDADGEAPIAVVYDRSQGRPYLFDRKVNGGAVTFGTSGYSCKERPVLYDRKTKGLWLFRGDDLVCVNGPFKGSKLGPYLSAGPATWGEWKGRYPASSVLVGNDRTKPIPAE